MVDDYLLITTDLSKAKSFLDMMNKGMRRHLCCLFLGFIVCSGHPEYGCFISKEKTMTNFDYDHQIMSVVDPQTRREWGGIAWPMPWNEHTADFYWCGYGIDMKDLSVSADYVRLQGKSKPFQIFATGHWLKSKFLELANTLTITRGRKLGAVFVQKMLR